MVRLTQLQFSSVRTRFVYGCSPSVFARIGGHGAAISGRPRRPSLGGHAGHLWEAMQAMEAMKAMEAMEATAAMAATVETGLASGQA